MTHQHRRLVLLAILLYSWCGCASAPPRHQLTVASSGLYAAIAVIDDTERALYTSGLLTPAQHTALAPDVLALLQAGKASNDVILVIGAPVPQPMQDVVVKLAAIAKRTAALLPDGATKSKLQTVILSAQTAATLLLVFLPPSTIGADQARTPPVTVRGTLQHAATAGRRVHL